MKSEQLLRRDAWLQQLGFWALNGALCAAPSFVLARSHGFSVAAMLTGVVALVLAYTTITATVGFRERVGATGFGRVLRWAVMARSAGAVVAAIGLMDTQHLGPVFALFVLGDIFPGIVAVGLAEGLWEAGGSSPGTGEFAPTLFITVVQGLLVSLEFALMAGLGAGVRRGWRRWRRRSTEVSPEIGDG